MRLCLNLAGADTATSALEWWRLPIAEVRTWAEVQQAALEKRQKELDRKMKGRR